MWICEPGGGVQGVPQVGDPAVGQGSPRGSLRRSSEDRDRHWNILLPSPQASRQRAPEGACPHPGARLIPERGSQIGGRSTDPVTSRGQSTGNREPYRVPFAKEGFGVLFRAP